MTQSQFQRFFKRSLPILQKTLLQKPLPPPNKYGIDSVKIFLQKFKHNH